MAEKRLISFEYPYGGTFVIHFCDVDDWEVVKNDPIVQFGVRKSRIITKISKSEIRQLARQGGLNKTENGLEILGFIADETISLNALREWLDAQ